jgi:hypothetical protein
MQSPVRRFPNVRFRPIVLCLVAAAIACGAAGAEPGSRSLGVPWEGRLVGGVQLAAEGEHFFTWDPVRKR